MQMQMQVFHLRRKAGGVLSGVSLGIKIHPPDSNGRHLSAFDYINNLMSLRMPNEWLEKLNYPKGKLGRGKDGWDSFLFFLSLFTTFARLIHWPAQQT